MGNVLSRLILAIFLLPLFTSVPIVIKLSMKMTMTDEGLLEIDGEFKVDDESIKFTSDDFELI